MKNIVWFGIVMSLATVASADGLVVNNKQTRTFDCAKDPTVLIAGNGNTITLLGKCKTVRIPGNDNTVVGGEILSISIDGNKNTLRVTAVDEVSINGDRNALTWSKTIDGDASPEVSILGEDNKVTKK